MGSEATKLETSVRQIEEAIWLFFEERDEVAIYTLAAAAHQVAHDLANNVGGRSFLGGGVSDSWASGIRIPANFAKHADRDPGPDATMVFPLDVSGLFILDTIRTLVVEIGWELSLTCLAFVHYYQTHHPELFSGVDSNDLPDFAAEFPVVREKEFWLEILCDEVGPRGAT